MNPNEDRLMRLHIPDSFILGFLAGRVTLDDADLPSDACVTRAYYEYERRSLCLIVQSASFEKVEMGYTIPSLPPLRMRTK